MANTKAKPKFNDTEKEIKTYNPTKSKVGRVIIVLLILGMTLGLIISAIFSIINVLS
ncbi:MAG: hypothetical protein KKE16_06450 [Firmicutes bacterium]|nr:hypothetical protein [Bacillota bacterium]